jgi:UDP-2-acetamido-3-amino-2,3-dideoxy-glucuronate N-acetyltransferase
MSDCLSIAPDVTLALNVMLSKFINLSGYEIGENANIGASVKIQKNTRVGKNCKISCHTFIGEGVTIEDNFFTGHGVTFINDTYRRATSAGGAAPNGGRLESGADPRAAWSLDWFRGNDSF